MKRALALLWLTTAACSSSLPARFVLEQDLGGYHYRRYQETLEAELPVAGNRAHGHTALYLQRSARGVAAISAFVTVYERPARLTETLRAALGELPGYELQTESIGGQYAWTLASSSEPSFWLWTSGRYLVKLGASARQRVPDAIVEAYAALYPSDLDSFGHAREGATNGGSAPEREEADDSAPKLSQRPGKQASAAHGALAEARRSR